MADEKNVTAFLVDFFSAIDLDSLIPIFLSNCSLALFMVLWILSAHKILVCCCGQLEVKIVNVLCMLLTLLWFAECLKWKWDFLQRFSNSVQRSFWRHLHANDDCKNHHVATLQLLPLADLSLFLNLVLPTCPAYSPKEFSKPIILRHRSLSAAINQAIMHSSTKNITRITLTSSAKQFKAFLVSDCRPMQMLNFNAHE